MGIPVFKQDTYATHTIPLTPTPTHLASPVAKRAGAALGAMQVVMATWMMASIIRKLPLWMLVSKQDTHATHTTPITPTHTHLAS